MRLNKQRLNQISAFILLSVLTAVLGGSLFAAYIEDLPVQLVQPDGEVIDCYATGDEFFNYAHDENGFTIIAGEDGFYYYGVEKDGDVVASEYRVDTVDPAAVGIEPRAMISEEEYRARRAEFEVPFDRQDTRAPHTGVMNNIVVYIRFADDTPFTRNINLYDSRLNTVEGQSVRDYFIEVSYDQLEIISHHFPEPDEYNAIMSYQDEMPRDHFRPYHAVNNPEGYRTSQERRLREHSMLVRAIEAVRDDIPEDLEIDADGDGRVDNVCFIIRGNADAWADLLWAHRWVLRSFEVDIHGKRVWDYTFQPENQTGISTLAHEMFHTLGAPDLYRYSHDGFTPVGRWDLMASGFVHMGAWMKYKYADRNWITDIPEIINSGEYSLKPLTSPENNAFMIRSPYSNREFFILEYRRRLGRYESSVPGSGLLVYRINSSINGNASGPPDEVYVFRPGGTPTTNGNVNMAAFSEQVGRTTINDFDTDPASFLANGNPGGLDIFDIGAAGDSITFFVEMIGDLIAPIKDRPIDGATDVRLNPTLEWGFINVADYYSLQVATDTDFDNIIIDEPIITETEYKVNQPLDVEQTYYWRLNSSDDEETSEWSDPWQFTISHFSPLAIDISGATHGDIAWADLNNNGFLDLVMTGEYRTVIYENKGDGSFELVDIQLPPLSRSALSLGDINNNGYLDIALTGRGLDNEPEAYICINGGEFSFAFMDAGLQGVMNGSIEFGDYNRNGLLDLILVGAAADDQVTMLFENTGDNNFNLVETPQIPGYRFADVAWGDFNNNGRLDLIISGTSTDGPKTEIYYQSVDGSFIAGDLGFMKITGSSISVTDFNKNGYLDFAVSGNSLSGSVTKIYRNNGDGTFTDIEVDMPGIALGAIKWGDLDFNGYPDLLLTGSNMALIFRNNGDETFTEVVSGLNNTSFSAVSWGDMDNDGDSDIALIGSASGGAALHIYQNNLGESEFRANTSPSTPQNSYAFVNQCSVTLTWDEAEDQETPNQGITYNISIGTEPGKEDFWSSMSHLDSGKRKIPAAGNVGSINELNLFSVPIGIYHWRVQAVDGMFAGSEFTAEGTFNVDTVSAEKETCEPKLTTLNKNYPNPFNPDTNISFTIASEEHVNLSVYNILGQKVNTLVDEKLKAGDYTITWTPAQKDGTSLSSGVYLYRMETDSFSALEKMLFLK